MKACSVCKLELPLTSFYQRADRPGKLRPECKRCTCEHALEAQRQNPERHNARSRDYYQRNKDSVNKRTLRWQNKNRDKVRQYERKWRQSNREKDAAYRALRRAEKSKATPSWLTGVHMQQIEIFYESATRLSDELGIKMSVDHIVPLKGKKVCGLHVPWNLQVIPLSDNSAKKNHFE